MKLIKSITERNFEIKEVYLLRKFYKRGFYKFYQSYDDIIAFLILNNHMKENKKEIKRINNMYRKLILKDKLNDRDLKIINDMMNKDFKIINEGLNKIEKLNASIPGAVGSFYRPSIVAVDMDEYPLDHYDN